MSPRAIINGMALAIPLWVLAVLGGIHLAQTVSDLTWQAQHADAEQH